MIKTSKLLISTLAIGLLLVFTQSCTKYEEGPGFTLRTAESRLIGSWRIVMFGEVPQIATSTYEFKKDGSFSVEGTQKLGIGSEGTWEWESDGYQALVLTSTSDGSTLTLDIKRLSNKEMITQSLTHPRLSLVVKTEFEKQ